MAKQIKKQIVSAQKPRDAKGHFIKTAKKYTSSPFIAPPPDPYDNPLPLGLAPFAEDISHVNIFRGISMAGTKIYRNLDEALRQSRTNSVAMLNDLVVRQPLMDRQLAVAGLEDHCEPQDADNPVQVAAAEHLTKLVKSTPRWLEFKRSLLNAIWFGKQINISNYQWKYSNGKKELIIKNWFPIIGDKIVIRNNDQEFGYLCHMPTGLREVVYTDIGRAELFNQMDMEAVCLHKHLIEDQDMYNAELAIGVHGTGIRSVIFWCWFLKQELLGYVFDCLQRYGAGGIQIWTFESGNPKSEAAVRTAAEAQTGNNVILFPKPIGTEKQGPGIEIISPDGAGLEYFYKFIDDYFNAQIRKFIVGDTGTSTTERISEGNAGIIKSAFQRIVKYDAINLEETLTKQLLNVFAKYNYPELDCEFRWKINVESVNVDEYLTACQRVYEMNIGISENDIREKVGLSKPEVGDEVKKPKMEDNTIRTPQKNVGNLGENLS